MPYSRGVSTMPSTFTVQGRMGMRCAAALMVFWLPNS